MFRSGQSCWVDFVNLAAESNPNGEEGGVNNLQDKEGEIISMNSGYNENGLGGDEGNFAVFSAAEHGGDQYSTEGKNMAINIKSMQKKEVRSEDNVVIMVDHEATRGKRRMWHWWLTLLV